MYVNPKNQVDVFFELLLRLLSYLDYDKYPRVMVVQRNSQYSEQNKSLYFYYVIKHNNR